MANEYTVYAQLENGLYDVMVGAVNYGTETVSFDVSLYDEDETLLGIKQLKLAPSESSICLFQGVEWKGETLKSRIDGFTYLKDQKN